MLRDLLKDADVHTMGMLLESGASGSLHMTFSSDVVRKALQQPLPHSCSMPGALRLSLYSSAHMSCWYSLVQEHMPSQWHAHVLRLFHMLCTHASCKHAERCSGLCTLTFPKLHFHATRHQAVYVACRETLMLGSATALLCAEPLLQPEETQPQPLERQRPAPVSWSGRPSFERPPGASAPLLEPLWDSGSEGEQTSIAG